PKFIADQVLIAANLRIQRGHVGMTGAEPPHQVGSLANHLCVMHAQLSDRLRLDSLRNRAGICARLAGALDLLEPGSRLRHSRARSVKLNVHLAELLLVYKQPPYSDDIMLPLLLHDPILCFANAIAESI